MRVLTSLPGLMVERSRAMSELLNTSREAGDEFWSSMYVKGHGNHWLITSQFISGQEGIWIKVASQ